MSAVFYAISAVMLIIGLIYPGPVSYYLLKPSFFFGAALGAFSVAALLDPLSRIANSLAGESDQKIVQTTNDDVYKGVTIVETKSGYRAYGEEVSSIEEAKKYIDGLKL